MKNRKIRIITLGSLSFMCIFYCIFTAITYPKKIKSLTSMQDKLNNSLTELKEEAENLKVEIEKLKDPEYIARFARENFFYSKNDGEYIIRVNKKDDAEIQNVEVETKDENNNILIYSIGAILIGIIIYIKVRSSKA